MPRLGHHSNLIVMRTLSKLGLAGLRLGVLTGAGAWLEHVDKVRLPYNVSVLTQLVAEKVLAYPDVLAQQAAAIRDDRARLADQLGRTAGVEPFASAANFILFRTEGAGRVFERLCSRGVLIKNLHGSHPLLENCLRVTVGTPDENARFVSALGAAVRG
jgi:histidinol-phosphate aminotransferase